MQVNKYLIITPKYRSGSTWISSYETRIVNTLKGGKMASNAVAIKLNFDLPDELFKKPQLEATIKVPKESVSPAIIDAKVLQNIKEEMQKATGFDITLSLVDQRKK